VRLLRWCGDWCARPRVEAWAVRRNETGRILVTEGNFTYVAIDDKGRPRRVKK
jgi:acyl-CoA thioesterase YciA